ncbi:MAG: thymidylate synthase [Candidatus Paceibacterota bacterium]
MKAYLDIVKNVLENGEKISTRQGTAAHTIAGAIFEHDMSKGFPLLTTKKMPFRLISTELEFFINGVTDKQWLLDRNNHIWDEWASPKKAPYGHDEISKKRMLEERDLGPIYGFQWRHFNAKYESYNTDYTGKGVDQLKRLVEILKTNPRDRRMIVSAWNPLQLEEMGLPPCHYSFQVTTINGKLNLMWNQRSVDIMLGLPFNIASYALLLSLLAKESGLKEGKLVGFLADIHLFENHVDGAREQLSRDPSKYSLSKIETKNWKSIFDWKAPDTEVLNYESYHRIPFEIAI